MSRIAYKIRVTDNRIDGFDWQVITVLKGPETNDPTPVFIPVGGGQPTAPVSWVRAGKLEVERTMPLVELLTD